MYVVTIEGGIFPLNQPPAQQGQQTAIDYILRSLAKDGLFTVTASSQSLQVSLAGGHFS